MDRRPLLLALGLLVAGTSAAAVTEMAHADETPAGIRVAGATAARGTQSPAERNVANKLGEPNPLTGQNAEGVWSKVDVAPTKTSIYVGTVSLRMPTFVRQGATFSASYSAKVFPYFFYNEDGTLTVDVTDEQLQSLAGGQQIKFDGTAVTQDGAIRKVTARATPKDATTGKLDVHVWVSNRIQLIFHTTYRFAG